MDTDGIISEIDTSSQPEEAIDEAFSNHKLLQNRLAWRFEAFDKKVFKTFNDCGSFLWFGKYQHRKTGDVKKHLDAANFCKNRFCPVCNWRKSRKMFKQTYDALQLVRGENPSYRYLFVTLTMKNPPVERTKTALKSMNEAWSRLMSLKRIKTVVKGFVRSTEFTVQKSDSDFVHPHFHAILIVSASYFGVNYIRQSELTDLWQKMLGVNYKPVVHIEIIKSKSNKKDELVSSASEAIKYAVKTTDLTLLTQEGFESLFKQLKGVRMLSFGGCLAKARRRLGQDDIENGELSDEKLDISFWKLIERLMYIYADTYILKSKELINEV
jgi:plasmid rolling circle replication initiator protein Rep